MAYLAKRILILTAYLVKNPPKIAYLANFWKDPPTPGGVLDKPGRDQNQPWFHFFLAS